MAHGTLLVFMRRHNEDGTWDSICLQCYRTAACSGRLAPAFAMHPLLRSDGSPCMGIGSRTIWAESISASSHSGLPIGKPAGARSPTLRPYPLGRWPMIRRCTMRWAGCRLLRGLLLRSPRPGDALDVRRRSRIARRLEVALPVAPAHESRPDRGHPVFPLLPIHN